MEAGDIQLVDQHAARKGVPLRRGGHPRGRAAALDPVPDDALGRDGGGRGDPLAAGGSDRRRAAAGVPPRMIPGTGEPARRPGRRRRASCSSSRSAAGFFAVFAVGFPPARARPASGPAPRARPRAAAACSPTAGWSVFAFSFRWPAWATELFGGADAVAWPVLLFGGFAAGWTFRFLYDFESRPDPSRADAAAAGARGRLDARRGPARDRPRADPVGAAPRPRPAGRQRRGPPRRGGDPRERPGAGRSWPRAPASSSSCAGAGPRSGPGALAAALVGDGGLRRRPRSCSARARARGDERVLEDDGTALRGRHRSQRARPPLRRSALVVPRPA